jgi:hypothetical protein
MPAAMDDKLTNNCVNMLKWAPILFLVNGYWMISNTQIFENSWTYIMDTTQTMKSGHTFSFAVN